MFHVVLTAPRIPHNTGQIARACHAVHAQLHLVRPLGFRIDAAALRRSAVGYLDQLQPTVHANGDALWQTIGPQERFWLVTKFGRHVYTEVSYHPGDWLIFGNETEGLPPNWLQQHPDRTIVIPMPNPEVRCLNLATSACVVLFEAMRQVGTGQRAPNRPERPL